MAAASRYIGLSSRERSSAAVLVAGVTVLLAVVLFSIARVVAPIVTQNRRVLALFDVPLPPPPPPLAPTTPPPPRPEIKRHAADVGHARPRSRTEAGSPAAGLPSVAPMAIVPVDAPQLSALDVGPLKVDGGIAAALASGGAGGGGSGTGSGAGNGSGGEGEASRYARAAWIRPPTQQDFEREWPRIAVALNVTIRVVLTCDIKKDGHPVHCAVASISAPYPAYGKAAIRLAQGALVRPVTKGAKAVDVPVIVPIVFALHTARAKTPAK